MIKKDATYKWDEQENDAFTQINQATIDAPVLFSPDYGKYFILYTFSSIFSIAVILT